MTVELSMPRFGATRWYDGSFRTETEWAVPQNEPEEQQGEKAKFEGNISQNGGEGGAVDDACQGRASAPKHPCASSFISPRT